MRASERRMRLIEELCERKFDTIDNLAFELGVSRRTICYDIEELSLSYPIFTAKGTGGGVWVRDGISRERHFQIHGVRAGIRSGRFGKEYARKHRGVSRKRVARRQAHLLPHQDFLERRGVSEPA